MLIGDVSGIPDDLAAVTGWFQDVPAGGPTGAELPRKLLETIGDTLAPGGRLYLPTGTLQDENAILAAARRVFGDNIEPVLERTFPLPDLVAKATATARLMKDGLLKLHQRGSRLLWELRVWRCVRLNERLAPALASQAHDRPHEHRRADRQQQQAVHERGAGDDHAEHQEHRPRGGHRERPERRAGRGRGIGAGVVGGSDRGARARGAPTTPPRSAASARGTTAAIEPTHSSVST